jgi:hypothetical protein
MAQRYSKLPSEVLRNATTVDFKIMDIADSYTRYLREKQENGDKPPAPKFTDQQLEDMLTKARSKQ